MQGNITSDSLKEICLREKASRVYVLWNIHIKDDLCQRISRKTKLHSSHPFFSLSTHCQDLMIFYCSMVTVPWKTMTSSIAHFYSPKKIQWRWDWAHIVQRQYLIFMIWGGASKSALEGSPRPSLTDDGNLRSQNCILTESLLAKATPTYVWISSCSDVRTQQSSSSLSWAVSFLSVYRSLSMGAYGCPRSAAADMLLWLEVRWINVSALLWCRACFPIARLWLIKHIDWPVSGLEGWPTAALCGDASPPSLSLSLRLKEESTGCSAISAQHRKHIVSSSIFFNHSYGSDVPVSCCFLIRLNLRGSTSLYMPIAALFKCWIDSCVIASAGSLVITELIFSNFFVSDFPVSKCLPFCL